MARYTGPVCRLCRREGVKLFLKGERCFTPSCPLEGRKVRGNPPGEHAKMRRKPTEYALQLREKQKARRIYGILERQFRRYFEAASRARGVTGEALLQLLERRLDNVVYRMGMATSRTEARQAVRHGHITVNGRRVNIPSFLVREGDEVAVHPQSRDNIRFKEMQERARTHAPVPWMEVDPDQMKARVLRYPRREEIDTPVQEHLIVELYSK
ncbi:MAG TPA: 30S ribosomal protein S4 [Firmicutes bacterium]|nr:30S ribosomal protein S4 [Bacillota bacterium]